MLVNLGLNVCLCILQTLGTQYRVVFSNVKYAISKYRSIGPFSIKFTAHSFVKNINKFLYAGKIKL